MECDPPGWVGLARSTHPAQGGGGSLPMCRVSFLAGSLAPAVGALLCANRLFADLVRITA